MRLELRNVVSNYPFERSHRFPGFQPDSGHREYSRLGCGVEETQLGRSARISVTSEELELWSVLRYCHAVGSVTMEDTMCWEIDYKFFAEQKKAQQTRIEQERRAGVIHQLLNEANKQGEPSNVEGTPAKETAPAK